MKDTLIIGGGIAGLSAAWRLRDRDVLLLEREPLPGGRTHSRKLGAYVYNCGAQVLLGNESPVARLADELGVPRTLIAKSRLPLYFRDRLHVARSQPEMLLRLPLGLVDKWRFAITALRLKRRYGALATRDFDANDQLVRELNRESLEAFLGPMSPDLRDLWSVFSRIADGVDIDVGTPYHPLMILLFFLHEEYFVEGGTNALTRNLHERLGGKAQLNATVRELRLLPDGGGVQAAVETRAGIEQIQARRCVFATPAPIVVEIGIDLPDWKRQALQGVEYASQTSAAFLLDCPSREVLGDGVWRVPAGGHMACAVTDPTFTYDRSFKDAQGTGMLRVYTGDRVSKEMQSLADEEALRILGDDLCSMFPVIRDRIIGRDIHHWKHANPIWKPGHTELFALLEAQAGVLHFCGDYTGAGFLNGSVLSGYRAAKEVHARVAAA
jgi:protoporphyrinogen/coproporphyrinogen III oxidase